MKRINFTNDNDYMIVGTGREIKTLEKRIRKNGSIMALYTEPAKYADMNKIYGINIYTGLYGKYFTVINADTVAAILIDNLKSII